MSRGRPRTTIGTFGQITVTVVGPRRHRAFTRYRDVDGRLRPVTATAGSARAAEAVLKRRLADRAGYGHGGVLSPASPFGDLCELWLADLELRDISEGTKDNYRDDLRLHVRPFFDSYTLGEITTGRTETFIKTERAVSYSRAKHSRTVLNQLFGFALRHDAIGRNPVEGTSPLPRPKHHVQAMTLSQVQAIRAAAARWRAEPGVMGPKPDGQVRDAIEILLGTSVRPGEVLALRPCDVDDRPRGMVIHVRGTIVNQAGRGTFRQDHPKTDASVRQLPVPEFAAVVIRRRLSQMKPEERETTIFHNRTGGPLTLHNFRRTFREFLVLANLQDSGITPRWYRRTGATVLSRGLGVDAAASFLGHTSKAVTEAHYIEPDRTIDFGPAEALELALRPVDPDGALLARPESDDEEDVLDQLLGDDERGDDERGAA
ncbi:tyrosine-type recombinase/integrase [Nocardioides soli]|uniref:Integrase n=1 Tax=Nocardioides soli TaxID=1036020 RepID=A0A7W4VY60_9ACTN|nr:tyrosine-type recombinase/integrase [Nocardioides soli]MBB3043693.1 integrase [Nocardioides soli]